MSTAAHQIPNTFEHIEVSPCSIHIGAEIAGVDITKPLSPEVVDEIRAAILRWKVVFFRDQPMDHDQQMAFATHFGELTPAHVVFGGIEGHPAVYSIAKFRTANTKRGAAPMRPWTGWHADITAAINPPWGTILRGDIVPPYGGDTQWTNLVAAYNALSPTMQAFCDSLHGIHRFDPPVGSNNAADYDRLVKERALETKHPLVRVHPETGEKSLYISPGFLKSIADLTPQESMHLLELLWEHSVRPEFTVRFRWEPGSVAFWDNRATAHLAPRDIFDSDFDRQFYRVTLQGDVPRGTDGNESTPVSGEPIKPI